MLRFPVLTLHFWLFVAAVGCGGEVARDGGSGGQGRGPSETSTEAKAMGAFALELTWAACERDVRCGLYLEAENCVLNSYASTLGVVPVGGPEEAHYVRYFGGVDLYQDVADEYALAARATLDACLSEMRDGPCNASALPTEACQNALVPKAPRAQYESCARPNPYLALRPCQAGFVCECDACTAQQPNAGEEGGPCASLGACQFGLECNGSECRPLPGLGAACNGSCGEGVCLGGACVRLAGLDEPCASSSDCAIDSGCFDGICAAAWDEGPGSSCYRDAPISCEASFCVFHDRGALQGSCGKPSLDVPAPCLGVGASGYCPAGSYASDPLFYSESCECLPQHLPGEACAYPEVVLGQCLGGSCEDGTCTDLPDRGEPCTLEQGCAPELFCTGDDGVCVALCVK